MKTPSLSQRADRDPSPNPLARALTDRRAAGREVIDLTLSNPTRAALPYPDDLLAPLADPGGLTYTAAPFGLPTARAAAAATFPVPVAPERVVCTASTSEAYGFLFKLLCDPGDEILVPRPSYPLFDLLAAYENVRLVPYPTRFDGGGAWHLDLPTLRQRVTPRTRAILLVSPNNPTGAYTSREELAALVDIGLPLVSDEVFAPYPLVELPQTAARSALEAAPEARAPIFALGGLSKYAALPQLKLSWCAIGGPDARVAPLLERLELIADTWLSLATPVQLAAETLITRTAPLREAIRQRTRANLATLRAALAPDSPVSLLPAQGGWYATLRVPRTQTDLEWACTLLETTGVYVHPGAFFGFASGAHLVLSLLPPAATFARGLGRILPELETRDCS